MTHGKINNWSIQPRGEGACICGQAEGHPNQHKFPDGADIRTSELRGGDAAAETVSTRSGSIYSLGDVDPNYEVAYPGARERLFRHIHINNGGTAPLSRDS